MNNSSQKGNKKKGKGRREDIEKMDEKIKIQTHIALLTCKHKPNNLQRQTTCIF